MNGADYQTTGIIAALLAIAGLIGSTIRGFWNIWVDSRKVKSEGRAEDSQHAKVLHDAAQEGIMAYNQILAGDNERLRKELGDAQDEIKGLKVDVDVLRGENVDLRSTVRDLTRRLERLESSDGG